MIYMIVEDRATVEKPPPSRNACVQITKYAVAVFVSALVLLLLSQIVQTEAPSWTTFAEYLQVTPPCLPVGVTENFGTSEIAEFLRVVDARANSSILGKNPTGYWWQHLACGPFFTRPYFPGSNKTAALCMCAIRPDLDQQEGTSVICSPRVFRAHGPWSRHRDKWLPDLGPALVPATLKLIDACNPSVVTYTGDAAYLAVRALQFLYRQPDAAALFKE